MAAETTLAARVLVAVVLFVVVPASAQTAEAPPAPGAAEPEATTPDEGPQLLWNPRWSRFGPIDYTVAGTAFAAGTALQFVKASSSARVRGLNPLDDAVREAFVGPDSTRDFRETVAQVSDVLLFMQVAYPLLVDGLLTALVVRRSPDVAVQMLLMDTLSFSVTLFVQNLLKVSFSRERPFVQECAGDPSYAAGCDPADRARNASFPGGHAATTFTAAGLVCVHHTTLGLHREPAADALACIVHLALATGSSLMRHTADRHWLTDTLTGATLGLLSGWLMPALLRYQDWNGASAVSVLPVPDIGPGRVGLSFVGGF
jgi:membrane-associated phospholipid phosphatase